MTITSGRAALALSGLALLIALGGTAYAANTVFSSDIVDGEVATVDVAPGSLGRSPRLWAQVSAAGARTRGTAIAATRTATGRYNVTFDQSVNACSTSVTPVGPAARYATAQRGGAVLTVRTFTPAGAAVNAAFDVVLVC